MLSLFSAKANAQGISYGAEIGVSASKFISVDSKQSWDPEFNTLPNIMIFAKDQLSESISLSIGIRFAQMGSSKETTIGHPAGYLPGSSLLYPSSFSNLLKAQKILKLNYVSIPVRFYFDIHSYNLFLFLGAEIGYLVSSELKYELEESQRGNYFISYSDKTKGITEINGSLIGGIGYNFNLCDKSFYIAAQYLYGLSEITDRHSSKFRTTDLSLLLGYYF